MPVKEPLFTPEETESNLQRKLKLFEIAANGEAMLVVGAGCSAGLFPTWGELMAKMGCEAQSINPKFPVFNSKTDKPLIYAQAVKNCLGNDRYHQFVSTTFKHSDPTHYRYHESLCNILQQNKFKAIITTNFDPVFQYAFAAKLGYWSDPVIIDTDAIEQADLYEYMLSWDSPATRKRILHLHGFGKHKGALVFAESEYKEKYGSLFNKAEQSIHEAPKLANLSAEEKKNTSAAYDYIYTLHRKLLWTLFSTRRLLFLGTSLTDPYFTMMLEFVRDEMHSFNYARHYLVLRIANINEKEDAMAYAVRLKKDFGIETVFFEETESKTGLANFVAELEVAVLPEQQTSVLKDEESKKGSEDGDEELTKQLYQIANQDGQN